MMRMTTPVPVSLGGSILLLAIAGGGIARPWPALAADRDWQPTVDFHSLVAGAWENLPQRQEIAARQRLAAARYRAGDALLPDAPYVSGSYVNDKAVGSNYNYITTQAELGSPVWLPGEGTATQGVGMADATAAEAAVEAAHVALASQLLDLATQVVLSSNALRIAGRRLATAQALNSDMMHRLHVGEASQSDQLAAEADAASAAATLSQAEADLAAARAALAGISGRNALPRLDAPTGFAGPIDTAGVLARHPRLVAGERAVAAAEANARLVRIQDRDDPQIGVQGTNEKQPGTRWDTRFGVTLRFSFATEARNAPRRAAADQATTQAMVQLAVARREVTVGLSQAAVMLAGAERANAQAARAADALERRRGQIERAWKLGEMSLIEVVRADALAFDAAYASGKADADLAAARLRMVLARGIVP